jgi:hypothetical protein
MEEAGLAVDPASLVWSAHWTPGAIGAARRFATWFFVAAAPVGTVVVDDGEISEHQWIRPTDALDLRARGEIEIIPPTWVTLHELSGWPTVADAMAAVRARAPRHYLTRAGRVEGGMAMLWDGDAAYDDLDTTRPGPRNRLVMRDDDWQLEVSDPG